MENILGALMNSDPGHLADRQSKIYGVFPAIVIKVHDEEKKRHRCGACQVYFPWLQDRNDPNLIAPWYRMVSPAAGGRAGFYSPPRIDDEVLCAAEHGDLHQGYIFGTLWNGKNEIPRINKDIGPGIVAEDTPLSDPTLAEAGFTPSSYDADGIDATAGGGNNGWFMRSRGAGALIFDDRPGAEKIVVASKSGKQRLIFDEANHRIEFVNSGGSDLSLSSTGTLTIQGKNVKIVAAECINAMAGKDIKLEAKGNMETKVAKNSKIEIGHEHNMKVGQKIEVSGGSEIKLVAAKCFKIESAQDNVELKAMKDFKADAKDTKLTSNMSAEMKAASLLNVESQGPTNVKGGAAVNVTGGVIKLN